MILPLSVTSRMKDSLSSILFSSRSSGSTSMSSGNAGGTFTGIRQPKSRLYRFRGITTITSTSESSVGIRAEEDDLPRLESGGNGIAVSLNGFAGNHEASLAGAAMAVKNHLRISPAISRSRRQQVSRESSKITVRMTTKT